MLTPAVIAVALTGFVVAADPPKSLAPAELDTIAVDVLRDVHDRGADLYNAADAAGAMRMYEGALRTVQPFLAHRPKVQQQITDGLTAVGKLDGVKAKAFRLHELIERVRDDLRIAEKPADEPKKPADEPKKPDLPNNPAAPPKPKDPVTPPAAPAPTTGTLKGVITLDGKPAAGCSLTLVSLDLPKPRVFTATADRDGKYTFPDPLPIGKYAATVAPGEGVKLPAKYQSTQTSGLTVTVAAGDAGQDLNLQSN